MIILAKEYFKKNTFSFLLIIFLIGLSHPACATDKYSKVFGKYTIHYSTFNSLFIPADIAKTHNLVRANDQTLVNISVQETATKKSIPAKITGTAKNLIQQTKTIDFKKIDEPGAVYYIGAIRHTDEEVFHLNFSIHVADEPSAFTFKISKKLYTDS